MNIHPLRPRDHEDAARVAISWLAERHRKGWRSAFEALLDLWRPEGPRDGWQLDEDGMTMVSINVGEWLIARGEIHARGGLREINAYLLGRDGPFLTPAQRDWIAQLRARPLRLYRVTDVQPGIGMTLIDEFDPQAPPQSVPPDGSVISMCQPRHRHSEWLKFLRLINRSTPEHLSLHLIVDNYATHSHPEVQEWLPRHARFVIRFTPTSASWLNMVERFFRDITDKRIRRDSFTSVQELELAINLYVAHHNSDPKSFIWTGSAKDILAKVTRAKAALAAAAG